MSDYNVTKLLGRLGTDPERITLKEDPEKFAVRFRVATNKVTTSKKTGEQKITTEWHNVKCWNQNAKYALQNIKKGDQVFIVGNLHYHNYEDENGQKTRKDEIIASVVIQTNKITLSTLKNIASRIIESKDEFLKVLSKNPSEDSLVELLKK